MRNENSNFTNVLCQQQQEKNNNNKILSANKAHTLEARLSCYLLSYLNFNFLDKKKIYRIN